MNHGPAWFLPGRPLAQAPPDLGPLKALVLRPLPKPERAWYLPGWTLPQSWAADDEEYNGEGGPRRFGRLRCRYTSDPKHDCEPNIPVRRALRERFLCGTVTQI